MIRVQVNRHQLGSNLYDRTTNTANGSESLNSWSGKGQLVGKAVRAALMLSPAVIGISVRRFSTRAG